MTDGKKETVNLGGKNGNIVGKDIYYAALAGPNAAKIIGSVAYGGAALRAQQPVSRIQDPLLHGTRGNITP